MYLMYLFLINQLIILFYTMISILKKLEFNMTYLPIYLSYCRNVQIHDLICQYSVQVDPLSIHLCHILSQNLLHEDSPVTVDHPW